MRIFFVRHGQTDANLQLRYCGWTDVPLNPEGRAQAARLRPLLAGRTFEAVYASPLGRTAETAALVLGDSGNPPGTTSPIAPPQERARTLGVLLDDALLEQHFGRFENLTQEEIAAAYPEEAAVWARNYVEFRFPGGESSLDLYARAARFVAELQKRHEGDVLVVSHLGTIVGMMASMIGLPGPEMWRLRVGNATLSRVAVGTDGYAYLDLLNARGVRPGV